jgi:hypothetical protein
MKTLKLIILIFAIFLYSNCLIAQVTIDGNAYLEGQTDHSNIKVLFVRIAPSALKDSVYTNVSGHFSKSIATGIYNITYSKSSYFNVVLSGQSLYANLTLPDTTLESMGIYGNLTGTLAANTYVIGGDILVPTGQTLIISPGALLKFKANTTFTIQGTLIAQGNHLDSIIFKAYNDSQHWLGIKFLNANSASTMSYCRIERSDSSGLRVINSNLNLHNMLIRYNYYSPSTNSLGPKGGGGISFRNSNSTLDSMLITKNTASFAGGIHSYSSHLQIRNSKIISNGCFYNPGGISIYQSSNVSLRNVIISDNYSTSTYLDGTGITCKDNSNFDLTNGIIANNQGYGIYIDGSPSNKARIINSIIDNNTGKGIAFYYETMYVINSIISNNPLGIYNNTTSGTSNYYLLYNNFYNNIQGNFTYCYQWLGKNVTLNANGDSCDAYFNIKKDPLFVNVTAKDYHLLAASPCIDAGINDTVSYFYDLDNYLRIFDGDNNGTSTVDMGVYEFGSPVVVINNVIPNENGISVYPVPAVNFITIETTQKEFKIEIFNIDGQIIKSIINPDLRTIIDIGYLPKGMYILKIQSDKDIISKKILKV